MTKARIILGIFILLVTTFGFLSIIYFHQFQSGDSNESDQHQVNLLIYHASSTEFNPNGSIKSKMTAPKATHTPFQNVTLITKPQLVVYSDKRIPWHVQADHGRMKQGSKVAYLWGHVLIHQDQSADSPATTITTSALTFYPDRSFATTRRFTTISRPGFKLKAKGMTVNFKSGVLTTHSQTQGTYIPNKPI